MKIFGGLPRLRIYTTLAGYWLIFKAMLSGTCRDGHEVAAFEDAVAANVGQKHAIMTPMARVGIYFVIKAMIKPGQKVILSPYTIADVINMVICARGVPVFADIDRDTCNMSPGSVSELLASETDVGAVLVTHFYGLAADIEDICALCDAKSVPVIEDASQAFGVTVNGMAVGTFGTAGVFSFGMYKNINCFYGGMVVTDDQELAASVRQQIDQLPPAPLGHYLKKVISGVITDVVTWPALFSALTFNIFRFGLIFDIDAINDKTKIDTDPKLKTAVPTSYLFKPFALQARLGLMQLPSAFADTERRIAFGKRYRDGLDGLPGIIIPKSHRPGEHMYWYFPIQYDDRRALVEYAMRRGRDISMSYHRNCAALECFKDFARPCPNAQKTANSVIYLPTYPRYSFDEVDKNVAVIREFMTGRSQ